jgi:hypothetical protein
MSLTNFIMLLYSLPWAGVECKTSMVIGTDCIGSCKSNYHMIMVATALYSHVEVTGVFSGVRVAQSLNFCALSCWWLFVSMVVGFTTTYAIGAYYHWCFAFNSRSGQVVQQHDKVCQWHTAGRWFSPGPPVSSTNKTDRHDIAEILLKVALYIRKPN